MGLQQPEFEQVEKGVIGALFLRLEEVVAAASLFRSLEEVEQEPCH